MIKKVDKIIVDIKKVDKFMADKIFVDKVMVDKFLVDRVMVDKKGSTELWLSKTATSPPSLLMVNKDNFLSKYC